MNKSHLLEKVQVLHGSNKSVVKDSVLIHEGEIKSFGEKALSEGKAMGLIPRKESRMLLAPCLVDPHSILEHPINGYSETLASMKNTAAHAGYGQIALLPRSPLWRDRPELLNGFNNPLDDVTIHLWGSFSLEGKGVKLAPHSDLIQHGAIGIAEDETIPSIELLRQALLINQIGKSPILLAPRDKRIQGNGIVREGIEALRAGWPQDPLASETLPLSQLIELSKQHPDYSFRLMNLSTKGGILLLSSNNKEPMSTVCWWHLVTDRAVLSPKDIGWRVSPSLGSPEDRNALIKALKEGTLSAVAVHSTSMSEEEVKHPPNEQLPGITGHHLVLPSLWQELVVKADFSIEKLWEILSFGPSKFLKTKEEFLTIGSRRWLLFDPYKDWIHNRDSKHSPLAGNQPFQGKKIIGKVIDCGLRS